MLKHEYIACVELHKKLKEKIKGYIFITITDNNLIVNIKSFGNMKFKYEIKNISLEMTNKKLNYDKVVNIILEKYAKVINTLFFI